MVLHAFIWGAFFKKEKPKHWIYTTGKRKKIHGELVKNIFDPSSMCWFTAALTSILLFLRIAQSDEVTQPLRSVNNRGEGCNTATPNEPSAGTKARPPPSFNLLHQTCQRFKEKKSNVGESRDSRKKERRKESECTPNWLPPYPFTRNSRATNYEPSLVQSLHIVVTMVNSDSHKYMHELSTCRYYFPIDRNGILSFPKGGSNRIGSDQDRCVPTSAYTRWSFI